MLISYLFSLAQVLVSVSYLYSKLLSLDFDVGDKGAYYE